ncbi:MAG: histidinol-phosphate aminotransferase family protein [Lachnospiraceae bacterium]|nr:histidinol-phosphate aminotransferase family protein [Lachnospiraceae bacterium]
MSERKWWFKRYDGVEKYTIHPTETLEGRLQFNENLWGPSPKCMEVIKDIQPSDLNYYDLREKDFLGEALAKLLDLPSNYLFFHCGSSEVIKAVLGIMVCPGDVALIPKPGWGSYRGMFNAKKAKLIEYRVSEGEEEYYHDIEDINNKAEQFDAKIIVITTPNMPTGNRISQENLEKILKDNPNRIVMVDECYYGCAEMNLDLHYLIDTYDNVIFIRTLSKIYGLANIRVGFGLASPEMVNLVDYLLPLHKIPNIIRKIAVAAIEDIEYTEKNKKEIIDSRNWLYNELNKRNGIKAFKSYSNFVYVKFERHDAKNVHCYMNEHGITTRLFDDLSGTHMRITVAPMEILEKCINVLDNALKNF